MGTLNVTHRSGAPDLDPGLAGVLQAADGWVTFDVPMGSAKNRTWDRRLELPTSSIERIEVEAISAAGSHWDGWRPTTGVLHGATKTAAVTGVLVVLKTGEHVLFGVPQRAPIEVRAELGPVASLMP